jgi:RNase P subunit RPR2
MPMSIEQWKQIRQQLRSHVPDKLRRESTLTCPRCGEGMHPQANALSRMSRREGSTKISVCGACGTEESMIDPDGKLGFGALANAAGEIVFEGWISPPGN